MSMPSLKSRLVGLYLKLTRKKGFASAKDLHDWIVWSRKRQSHLPPASIMRRMDVTSREIDGFPVYDVVPRERSSGHIVYFHGGAYCFEITSYHWKLIADIAERTGARVTVPIYPLAPEHDFHDMFRMAMATYRSVLGQSRASDVVFMGDSAGGNMAVVLTMMAARKHVPLPGRHVLISPGLDMAVTEAMTEAACQDPWLDVPGGEEAIRLYSAGIDVTDWRISPRYGDLSVLPKTLIFTSTRDLLCSGTMDFAAAARQAGIDVDLVVEEGMYHVWPLIETIEARRARDRIVEFLREVEMPKPGRAPAPVSVTALPAE
ncbi:esterase [Aquibium oceanicum]|uniref:Esterase n=2 Tax=Aquibium oceanicum TaxID=1670800 RepID=A0A1L3ST93_9HYPH|nr:esterase [Aquibium oceanicum]